MKERAPFGAIIGDFFPCGGIDVERFHVTLAGVFKAKGRTTAVAFTFCELSVQYILWDPPIFHSTYVTESTKPILTERGVHSCQASAFQDYFVLDLMLPRYA